MKLYVWENVLVDYTPGLMVALANSIEEARAMLKPKVCLFDDKPTCECTGCVDLNKEPKVYIKPIAVHVHGGA